MATLIVPGVIGTVLFIKLAYVAAVIVIGGRCAGIDL